MSEVREKKTEYDIGGLVTELLQMKKPLLVHNGSLDLLHIYDKFHRALPPCQREYQEGLNSLLPTVIDTKHLVSTSHQLSQITNKESSLQKAYTALKDKQTLTKTGRPRKRQLVTIDTTLP